MCSIFPAANFEEKNDIFFLKEIARNFKIEYRYLTLSNINITLNDLQHSWIKWSMWCYEIYEQVTITMNWIKYSDSENTNLRVNLLININEFYSLNL